MREAFCNWLETEHGVKPIAGIEIDALANMTNPQLFAGFQAAYQLQQKRIEELVEIADSLYDIRSLVKGAKYKGSLDHALMLIEQKINELRLLTKDKS